VLTTGVGDQAKMGLFLFLRAVILPELIFCVAFPRKSYKGLEPKQHSGKQSWPKRHSGKQSWPKRHSGKQSWPK
jgi:hypothetical protein